jgi:lysophospholipase L1-like esterase
MKKSILFLLVWLTSLAIYAQEAAFYLDFGPDDVVNGNITLSPDDNGNVWNNITAPWANGTVFNLMDYTGAASGINLVVLQDFLMNGIQNGGLLDPDEGLLGEFAIPTATQDYFFTTGTALLELNGLETGYGYVFHLFGTRNTGITRRSEYKLTGFEEYVGELQTSGADLGGAGYDGNNRTVLVTDTIVPGPDGRIELQLTVLEGGFAYLGLLKMESFDFGGSGQNHAPIADAGEDQNLIYGTTLATLMGTALDQDGDPLTYQWTQLTGPAVQISEPGNLTTQVEGLEDGNTYSFELLVSDGLLEDRDTVAWTVLVKPDEPVIGDDVFRAFYIDFGPDDGVNGNATSSPDENGNFWNNVTNATTYGDPVFLQDYQGEASDIKVRVISDLSSNGIQNGGLLDPDPELLNDLGVATATQDYFFTVSSGKITFEQLDPTRAYRFNLFASRNTPIVRKSEYIISGTNEVRDTLQTSGPSIGSEGYDGNNNVILTTEPVQPNANGRIIFELSMLEGGFAYLGCMRLEEVSAYPVYLVDFGPDDGINGNATDSPDMNGNFWNNATNPSVNADTLWLTDTKDKANGSYLTILSDFQMNGILNGGLLAPEDSLLGYFAVPSVTEDYFFTTAISSLQIGGLNEENGYVFSLFGTRNSGSTRITEYVLSGQEMLIDSLQTSGTDLGGPGYNGNNRTVVVTDTLMPDAQGTISITVNVGEGGFAYLGFLQMEEIVPAVPEDPACTDKDSLLIAVMGSSVADGYGAQNAQGYAYQFFELLKERANAGEGEDWNMENISIGGNNTIAVMNRWETDLLPLCSRYVVYGLSLGNEGIHEQGQPAFIQFRNNMKTLIEQSREQGIEPLVVNCYARSDFNEYDYDYTKQMNLIIHEWDVASINVLGAIEEGSGKWAPGYFSDPYHPNTAGHKEFAYAFVPSLFDALHQGKPQPGWIDGSYISFTDEMSDKVLEFTPEATVHSFTVSFEINTSGSGPIAAFTTDEGGFGGLRIDGDNGFVDYVSSTDAEIRGNTAVNDGTWHRVTLTHFYAWGKTLLYVDDQLQGTFDEKTELDKIVLGEKNAPEARYRNWFFYRSGMNQDEIAALVDGRMLKSSLELYAPLDGEGNSGTDALVNLAQSLNTIQLAEAYEILSYTDRVDPFQPVRLKVFPNPTRFSVTIEFHLEERQQVKLGVYDSLGQPVAVLVDGILSVGEYSLPWSPLEKSSAQCEGVYLIVMETESGSSAQKLMISE